MTCDDIRDRLEAYALGDLTPEEREQVAAHLAGCPACRAELAEIENALAHLPVALAAASGLQAPATVKDRLLETVRSDQPTLTPIPVTPASRLRWRRRDWWTASRVAFLAIVVALVVSLGWSFRLNQTLSEERQLREAIADLVGQQEIVLEIVDGQDTARLVLRSTSESSDAYGKVFTRPEFAEVVVMAARLPDAPEGEAYHVWLTTDGETEHAGVLDVNEEGFGLLVIDADELGPEYESARVTLQPLDAETPSDPPVLIWEVG